MLEGEKRNCPPSPVAAGFDSKVSVLLITPFGIGTYGTGKDNFNLQMKLL